MSYDAVLGQLQQNILPTVPDDLHSYFTSKIEPMLKHNVEAGCGNWTNNACESINHVLKQHQQWKLHMLPDLVTNLRSLVDAQYADADRALSINFVLCVTVLYVCMSCIVYEMCLSFFH